MVGNCICTMLPVKALWVRHNIKLLHGRPLILTHGWNTSKRWNSTNWTPKKFYYDSLDLDSFFPPEQFIPNFYLNGEMLRMAVSLPLPHSNSFWHFFNATKCNIFEHSEGHSGCLVRAQFSFENLFVHCSISAPFIVFISVSQRSQ